jgi:opacity protein-like surface antigen
MKLTSILGALSAALIILAASAAEARQAAGHAPAVHASASGAHYLNPQPLPPG